MNSNFSLDPFPSKEHGTEIMLSRELSFLDFNSRVLDEACTMANPVLERLKFIAIFSSNLDEFFMVRVAGLRQLLKLGDTTRDMAGLLPSEQLKQLRSKLDKLLERRRMTLTRKILPELAANGIHLVSISELVPEAKTELKHYFTNEIMPVLTPLAVDPSHPFPVLNNGAIEIAVRLERETERGTEIVHAFVEVPEKLPRFVEAIAGDHATTLPLRKSIIRPTRESAEAAPEHQIRERVFILLEDLIIENLPELFAGCRILECTPFRITRDMDFNINEEGVEDLLSRIEHTLLERRSREPIRLEFPWKAPQQLSQWLSEQFQLDEQFRYRVSVPLHLKQFFELAAKAARPGLCEKNWPPLDNPQFATNANCFDAIREHGEILNMVPFQKFDPVLRLLETAASDPNVLAIKQTLYRVSGDSPVVRALQHAAAVGKQVTVIVELKARFDEGNNIAWARKLEESGAHVVYGISGLKIHGKALLIVRKEEGLIRRYVHLATGNYNDKTAKLYTDTGIFSYNQTLCAEVSALFNIMTGYAMPQKEWSKIAAAPFDLRQRLYRLIEREIALSTPRHPGRIIAKMNSLADPDMIRAFYQAAEHGVKVDLIVRGICCLRPGVGKSKGNLRVISIVDRFLEHSRIYYFGNGGDAEIYLSSADCMTRNLDRRIEILFPVERSANKKNLYDVLQFQLADREKQRMLRSDGRYSRPLATSYGALRSQQRTYLLFAKLLAESRRDPEQLQIFQAPDHQA